MSVGETFIEPLRVDPEHPAPVTLRLPRATVMVDGAESNAIELSQVREHIARGERVPDKQLATLVRLYESNRRPPRLDSLVAQWFFSFLLILIMTAALRHSSSKRGVLLKTQVGLLSASLLFLAGAKAFLLLTDLPAYLIPVAVIPLWASMFLNARTGLEIGIALSFLFSSLLAYDPLSVAVFLSGSITAALCLQDRKNSIIFLVSGLGAACATSITYVAAKELLDGFNIDQEIEALKELWRSELAAAAAAGILAGLIAFAFQWPIARMLGIMSRGQILDLTNLDHPLLKKMAREAPASWEHSRATANIAEAAAAAIGADASLTRVGAYYHDLGKTCQPKFFVENLEPDERSPHDGLDPRVSADAIMAHVVEGTRILREEGIPEPVVEFVYSHHGTSVIEFFWHKCQKEGNSKGLTEDVFRYPGMRPRTAETAILMLVDAIEAAAHTIDLPNREKLSDLVQHMIFAKLKQGQLDESGLTIEELKKLSWQITDTLWRVYHSRIRYPWQETKEKSDESTPTSTTGKHKALEEKKENHQAEPVERATKPVENNGNGNRIPT
ncbi:MAG: HDIG domain-containing protein [Deltaproteobacteria bacterium]|nr:HDIG domain-containing protein [Deltaproteobacteria bacterium]